MQHGWPCSFALDRALGRQLLTGWAVCHDYAYLGFDSPGAHKQAQVERCLTRVFFIL